MRYLVGATNGYLALPALVAVFVGFLRAAAAIVPAGRGSAVAVRPEEERAAA